MTFCPDPLSTETIVAPSLPNPTLPIHPKINTDVFKVSKSVVKNKDLIKTVANNNSKKKTPINGETNGRSMNETL
jgi:hypothetical protein